MNKPSISSIDDMMAFVEKNADSKSVFQQFEKDFAAVGEKVEFRFEGCDVVVPTQGNAGLELKLLVAGRYAVVLEVYLSSPGLITSINCIYRPEGE